MIYHFNSFFLLLLLNGEFGNNHFSTFGSQQQQQKYVGQRAKLAARPPGILPVLPMASPPLLITSITFWGKRPGTRPGSRYEMKGGPSDIPGGPGL